VGAVLLADVPMPATVAARPRDARGYPVPAITPWQDGVPVFATNGVARAFLCAVEHRCSVCGTTMDGPVWRVVGGTEAAAIATELAAGRPYRNHAPTGEAPGHRSCMLYAAVVCPYLARPNARRGQAANVLGLTATRGDARGESGAVVGYDSYEFEYGDTVQFTFPTLREFLPYEIGDEHLPELVAAIADAPAAGGAAPAYLLDDEAAAQAAFQFYIDRFLG
jgi:hypothetical protein